ncbi:MAG: hypothetical protein IJO00_02640 [Clostridia bacterium]|nr:hypothetical protein [Clostridia bacterium]
MPKPRILVVGGACAEANISVGRIPMPGERLTAESQVYIPEGEGVNTAVSLSRLGADCLLCTKLGDDFNGKNIKAFLDSEDIDTRFVASEKDGDTALELIINDGHNSGRRIYCPGVSKKLDKSDIEDAFISYPDAVVIHSDIPGGAANSAIELASSKGLPVFLMSAGDEGFYSSLPDFGCEIFSANEEEVFSVTGISPTDQEKCMRACMVFMQKLNAKYIVLRLGERGYFVYDGMYYSFIAAYDVPNPSSVSSDNAYAAALALEYLRSEGDIRRSCEFAAIVCAIYLTRGGGFRGYPTDEEIRDFIESNELDFDYGEEEYGIQ